jgi:hypothetical protein
MSEQTPDQASTEITSPEHMSFVDERPNASDPIVSPVPIAPTASLTAPDSRMTAEDLLKNPIQVGAFAWSTTDTRSSALLTLNLPEAFTTRDSFHRAILGIYAFLKCNLVLTFKLASTRFHSGALWIVSDPMHQMLPASMPLDVSNPAKIHNVFSDSSQPRAEIDASDSNPVTISIPFVHVQDRLTTNSKETWDVMTQITVSVASPLRTASGTVGEITCQVFLHCEDISLDVPIYPHTATIPSFAPPPPPARRVAMHSGDKCACKKKLRSLPRPPADEIRHLITKNNNLSQQMIANNNTIRSLLKTLAPPPSASRDEVDEPLAVSQHGLTDSFTKLASSAATSAWNVATGNYGQAMTSAVSGVKSVFNLDKPADPLSSVTNCLSPYSPLSHGSGVDASIRLGNAPIGQYLEERYAGGSVTDMDIHARAQIPGLVSIIPWTTDDPAGKVLLSVPVLPSFCNTLDVVGPTGFTSSAVFNTNLSYIAEMFVYWRMSMQYTLKVYSSSFHAGGLMCSFTPNQRLTAPTDLSQHTNLSAASFDIQGNTLFSVVCPMQSSVTRKTYAPWATVSSREKYTDQHILGYLDIVVYKQLLAPSNVSPAIEVFLFQNAWKDVEFDSPRIIASTLFSLPRSVPAAPPVEDDADSDPPVIVDMHSLSTTSSSRKAPPPVFLSKSPCDVEYMNAFNEGARDFRELSRRFTINSMYSMPLTLPTAPEGPSRDLFPALVTTPLYNIPVTPLLPSGEYGGLTPVVQTEGLNTANSFCARIARMNVFYHGGMRYKIAPIVNRTQSVLLSAVYTPDGDVIESQNSGLTTAGNMMQYSGYATALTNTSQSASLQVETPFMNGYNQIVIETVEPIGSFPPDVTRSGFVNFVATTDKPTDFPNSRLTAALLLATADDAVFHYPVAPPITYQRCTLVDPPL